MSELKLCPFCGEEELLLLPHASRAIQTIVQCKGCLMGGPIAAWNRRASPTPEAIRSDALEEAARVADDVQESEREEKRFDKEGGDYDPYSYGAGFSDGSITTSVNIGTAIRALSPPVKDTK